MIELVIKISEKAYNALTHTEFDANLVVDEMRKAIANGTPLPKGHGRLIDADELKTMSYEVLIDTDNPNRADGLSACNGLVEEDIDLAPTIIEGSESEW